MSKYISNNFEVLKEAFEHTPNFFALLSGPEFTFVMANPRYYEVVGHRDVIGKTLFEALPELQGQGIDQLLKNVYETGENFYGVELPVKLQRTKNGPVEDCFLDFVYKRIDSNDGPPYKILVSGVDVTEKVIAHKRIEESEKMLRTFADFMPHMAFIATGEGAIIFFNKKWYEYIGISEGTEGWGWKNYPIHHPDDLERTVERWNYSLKTGAPYEIEYRLRRHDGEYRWHIGKANPLKDENGKVIYWIGTNSDIHEAKLSAEKLLSTQDELKKSLQARDEFLSIASHELKTPLTALKLQTQSMKRNFERDHKKAFSEDRINLFINNNEKQISRIVRLVDDMLDISRIESGKLSYRFSRDDLGDIILDICDRLQEQIEYSKSKLILHVPRVIFCNVDRPRIEQVIINLLTNALRYGNGNEIEVRLTTDEQKAKLLVKDHGIGIAAENQDKIFERYERFVDPKEISGLGLGLFITKEIVEAHHGKIWVQSKLGHGSEFYVELPLA